MTKIVTWCDNCHHNRGMHQDWDPHQCAYPYCGCKRYRSEPTLTDYTKSQGQATPKAKVKR